MRPLQVLAHLDELLAIICDDPSWLLQDGGGNLLKQDAVSSIFGFREITLYPIRASILHDMAVPVFISWFIIEIQDFVTQFRKLSKCGKRWDTNGFGGL